MKSLPLIGLALFCCPVFADPATGFQIGPDMEGQYHSVRVFPTANGLAALIDGSESVFLDCGHNTFMDPRDGQWLEPAPGQLIGEVLDRVCAPMRAARAAAQAAYDAASPAEKARIDAQRAAALAAREAYLKRPKYHAYGCVVLRVLITNAKHLLYCQAGWRTYSSMQECDAALRVAGKNPAGDPSETGAMFRVYPDPPGFRQAAYAQCRSDGQLPTQQDLPK